MSATLEVVASGRGLYKRGVTGRIVDGGERVVFLGSDCQRTVLPEFTVQYDCGTTNEHQQYGRDFVFRNSEEGREILGA